MRDGNNNVLRYCSMQKENKSHQILGSDCPERDTRRKEGSSSKEREQMMAGKKRWGEERIRQCNGGARAWVDLRKHN
jgi:hypothetical protein